MLAVLLPLVVVCCRGHSDLEGGRGGEGASGQPVDADGDGHLSDVDCDDTDDSVYPGATEVCDGVDNDCDDEIDGPNAIGATAWYPDQDGDGWGLPQDDVMACEQPEGYAAQPGDCDDAHETVYPGAAELCDLLDNDCDGFGDVPPSAVPDPPWSSYYTSADSTSDGSLRLSLHEIVDDHQYVPYTSTATDTWDVLELADEDRSDPTRIVDIYRNASYPKYGAGNMDYDREHLWPQSYLPDDYAYYPRTDCHHLFLCDFGYNASRGKLPFDVCATGCDERETMAYNSQGGGSGVYPGNSNWRKSETWETWVNRRGDVARALLYLDVRYEGDTHGGTGHAEPDLILTDDRDLIVNSLETDTEAYMGILSTLLIWNCEDPVSSEETQHHEVVYSHQGNRNPFVDYPEWAYCVFLDQCGE